MASLFILLVLSLVTLAVAFRAPTRQVRARRLAAAPCMPEQSLLSAKRKIQSRTTTAIYRFLSYSFVHDYPCRMSPLYREIKSSQRSYSARSVSMVGDGRIPIMAGNWKMNTDAKSSVALAKELVEQTQNIDRSKVEVAIIPPALFLADVAEVLLLVHSHRL
jgi:Triosephosphate isomerase